MSNDEEININENVGIALGLVVAAGASTGLGAAVVFIPSLVKLASRRVLAGSLGFSAGVMLYVSFVEILGKAKLGFEDAGNEPNVAYMYATVCFFAGVVIMIVLNLLVAKMLGGHGHSHSHDVVDDHDDNKSPVEPKPTTRKSLDEKILKTLESDEIINEPAEFTPDPVEQLNTLQRMGSVLMHEQVGVIDGGDADDAARCDVKGDELEQQEVPTQEELVDNAPGKSMSNTRTNDEIPAAKTLENNDNTNKNKAPEGGQSDKKLVKMGLNTALAIGLHNFPEGLATFVAALEDPKVGAVLAVAIAIHNIPEGLCVALPIYYATGNRLRAFLWALLSGASEVVAALLGWAILASVFTETAYATLFGLVAGMMVIISIRELLPTAHFYDPKDTVVTYSFIGGAALMALSLILFQI